MTLAIVLPFPIARRRAYIAKQVCHASLMNPDAGERYMHHQLDIQAETMRRRGIDEDLVQQELLCMRRAIKAEFAGNLQQRDG